MTSARLGWTDSPVDSGKHYRVNCHLHGAVTAFPPGLAHPAHLQPLMDHPGTSTGGNYHKSTAAAAHAPYLVLLKRHGSRNVSSSENLKFECDGANIWHRGSIDPWECLDQSRLERDQLG